MTQGIDAIKAMLARLVAHDTTSHKSNLALIEEIEAYLAGHGIAFRRIPDPELPKASLWVTIGPRDQAGYVLSAHTDTVPVDGQAWSSDPFTLTERDGCLFGRGTADMKGFLAVCLARAPRMQAARLTMPIHLAISYDEETGCTGVRPMLAEIARMPVRPKGCFVGEPSLMQVLIGHKSKHAMRAIIRGKAAHTATPADGVNAVEAAAEFILLVRRHAGRLAATGARDDDYDAPYTTGLSSIVRGGVAQNIVPDRCEVEFEFRGIGADDPKALCAAVITDARATIETRLQAADPACGIDFIDTLEYPALDTPADAGIVTLAKELSRRNAHGKAGYGTEAGLFTSMASIPSVVVGPGSIAQAHKPDEWIAISELAESALFIDRLIEHCSAGRDLATQP